MMWWSEKRKDDEAQDTFSGSISKFIEVSDETFLRWTSIVQLRVLLRIGNRLQDFD